MPTVADREGCCPAIATQAALDGQRFDVRRTVEELQAIYEELVDATP